MIPRISVVCPTYNSAGFIPKTIETVRAQTRWPFEMILSDDGSSDKTPDLVERILAATSDFPGRVLRNPHHGPGAARNAGIQAATGDWIAFLDSDDEWLPEKLARVGDTIGRHPNANFICHYELERHANGNTRVLEHGSTFDARRPLGRQLFRRNLFSTSAVVCRRQLLLEHGMFDEYLMSSQDYELWLRLAPAIRPAFIAEPLSVYVIRPGSITAGKRGRRLRNLLRVLTRHRRLAGYPLYAVAVARTLAAFGIAALRRS